MDYYSCKVNLLIEKGKHIEIYDGEMCLNPPGSEYYATGTNNKLF